MAYILLSLSIFAFTSDAWAQAAGGGQGGGLESLIPLILIFVIFYFLLIRPQQKKLKQHQEMVGGLKRGDKVVTAGGVVGKITKVEGEGSNLVEVEIAPSTTVKIVKTTISDLHARGVDEAEEKPASASKPKPKKKSKAKR